MHRLSLILLAAAAVAGCRVSEAPANAPDNALEAPAPAAPAVTMALSRIDCGRVDVADFTGVFSDRKAYPAGARQLASSCYLIRRGDTIMIWDTGFSIDLKGKKRDMGGMVASLDRTVVEQLADGGLKPADVDVLGISHSHADHTGQAALFPTARLIIGKADFDGAIGKDDPFGPWRKARRQRHHHRGRPRHLRRRQRASLTSCRATRPATWRCSSPEVGAGAAQRRRRPRP